MQITLKYFAILRDTLGRSEEVREVAPGTTAGALLETVLAEAPRLTGLRKHLLIMVNQEYVDSAQELREGDEFVLIPPVSGGEGGHFVVTRDPLDARAVEALVAADDAGAIVTFTGAVRNHARGKAVTALDYDAYIPAAERMLARIGEEIREQWGINRVAIVHRIGLLGVGEASVVIAVASPHRDEAFAACRHAIERIKQIVPIWKKEHYADGAIWVGSEADYQREIGRMPPADGA